MFYVYVTNECNLCIERPFLILLVNKTNQKIFHRAGDINWFSLYANLTWKESKRGSYFYLPKLLNCTHVLVSSAYKKCNVMKTIFWYSKAK